MIIAKASIDSSAGVHCAAFHRIGVIGKYQSAHARLAVDALIQYLECRGHHVILEAQTQQHTGLPHLACAPIEQLGQLCDLAVVIGGDGTMIGAARHLAPFNTPVIGINQGRLGFMTDIPIDEYPVMLGAMLEGAYRPDLRHLMDARVVRNGETVFETLAVNDVVVNRAASGMIELEIQVGGHFVARQRSDGLIIATPTGSTAYAMSAGGSLLHPSIGGWMMVPLAPHMLSNRPIVLPSHQTVSIEITGGKEVMGNFDMQSLTALHVGDRIEVRQSPHQLTLLHPVHWNHFDTLRKKLYWNEAHPNR
jgi:NAD+ kinase